MTDAHSKEVLQRCISQLESEIADLREKNAALHAQRKAAAIEQRYLEARLRKAQNMEAFGILAGGIAHDFNNILASLIGFTELALDDAEKGSWLEDNLQEVYRAGKRAEALVKQILIFARRTEEDENPIRVDIIAKEVLKFMREIIPVTISIVKNIRGDIQVMGDPVSLYQVLMNLCAKAGQAMEEKGGILEMRLKDVALEAANEAGLPPGDYAEIMITDTGKGISAEKLKHIFDPDFMNQTQGTVISFGLAKARTVINKYKGEILVQSREGCGSVFRIYLPKLGTDNQKTMYQADGMPGGRERILLVDDEDAIAKMGLRSLESLGYRVTVRTSSVEALNLIVQKPDAFDLVITDMTMPNMAGDRLTLQIRSRHTSLPIILLTGYSRYINQSKADALGVQAFLTKPVTRETLAKTIRRVLDEAAGVR